VNLSWSRSATKHRISHERSRHVIEHGGLVFEQDPPAGAAADADQRLVYLGDYADGIALEVMAVETRGRKPARDPCDAIARPLPRPV
jgi:hypothetical protein